MRPTRPPSSTGGSTTPPCSPAARCRGCPPCRPGSPPTPPGVATCTPAPTWSPTSPDQVRESSADADRPDWARQLSADPRIVAELAVWRAATAVPDSDLRPTGPVHPHRWGWRWQHHLHRQLADTHPATTIWAPLIAEPHPRSRRIRSCPPWPAGSPPSPAPASTPPPSSATPPGRGRCPTTMPRRRCGGGSAPGSTRPSPPPRPPTPPSSPTGPATSPPSSATTGPNSSTAAGGGPPWSPPSTTPNAKAGPSTGSSARPAWPPATTTAKAWSGASPSPPTPPPTTTTNPTPTRHPTTSTTHPAGVRPAPPPRPRRRHGGRRTAADGERFLEADLAVAAMLRDAVGPPPPTDEQLNRQYRTRPRLGHLPRHPSADAAHQRTHRRLLPAAVRRILGPHLPRRTAPPRPGRAPAVPARLRPRRLDHPHPPPPPARRHRRRNDRRRGRRHHPRRPHHRPVPRPPHPPHHRRRRDPRLRRPPPPRPHRHRPGRTQIPQHPRHPALPQGRAAVRGRRPDPRRRRDPRPRRRTPRRHRRHPRRQRPLHRRRTPRHRPHRRPSRPTRRLTAPTRSSPPTATTPGNAPPNAPTGSSPPTASTPTTSAGPPAPTPPTCSHDHGRDWLTNALEIRWPLAETLLQQSAREQSARVTLNQAAHILAARPPTRWDATEAVSRGLTCQNTPSAHNSSPPQPPGPPTPSAPRGRRSPARRTTRHDHRRSRQHSDPAAQTREATTCSQDVGQRSPTHIRRGKDRSATRPLMCTHRSISPDGRLARRRGPTPTHSTP